jgi:putative inorganic carbon (HCO3(-)) transporter
VAVLGFRSRERVDVLSLRIPALLVVLAGLLILLVSQSRSAWFAVWVTAVLVLVRGKVSSAWRVLLGFVILMAPIGMAAHLGTSARDDYVSDAGVLWDAVAERAHILSAGVAQYRQSPWFGIGLNQFRNTYVPPASVTPYDVAHCHNVVLQTALDIGLLGLTAYGALVVWLMVRADRTIRGPSGLSRAAGAGAGTVLVAINAFGLTDAVALGAKIGSFQWVASGLILSAWRLQQGAVERRARLS